jgi:hypothetical protein
MAASLLPLGAGKVHLMTIWLIVLILILVSYFAITAGSLIGWAIPLRDGTPRLPFSWRLFVSPWTYTCWVRRQWVRRQDRRWVFLALLLQAARDLNEAGEYNEEYVRGQANLIQDVTGLLPGDEFDDIVIAVIMHRMTVEEGLAEIWERQA